MTALPAGAVPNDRSRTPTGAPPAITLMPPSTAMATKAAPPLPNAPLGSPRPGTAGPPLPSSSSAAAAANVLRVPGTTVLKDAAQPNLEAGLSKLSKGARSTSRRRSGGAGIGGGAGRFGNLMIGGSSEDSSEEGEAENEEEEEGGVNGDAAFPSEQDAMAGMVSAIPHDVGGLASPPQGPIPMPGASHDDDGWRGGAAVADRGNTVDANGGVMRTGEGARLRPMMAAHVAGNSDDDEAGGHPPQLKQTVAQVSAAALGGSDEESANAFDEENQKGGKQRSNSKAASRKAATSKPTLASIPTTRSAALRAAASHKTEATGTVPPSRNSTSLNASRKDGGAESRGQSALKAHTEANKRSASASARTPAGKSKKQATIAGQKEPTGRSSPPRKPPSPGKQTQREVGGSDKKKRGQTGPKKEKSGPYERSASASTLGGGTLSTVSSTSPKTTTRKSERKGRAGSDDATATGHASDEDDEHDAHAHGSSSGSARAESVSDADEKTERDDDKKHPSAARKRKSQRPHSRHAKRSHPRDGSEDDDDDDEVSSLSASSIAHSDADSSSSGGGDDAEGQQHRRRHQRHSRRQGRSSGRDWDEKDLSISKLNSRELYRLYNALRRDGEAATAAAVAGDGGRRTGGGRGKHTYAMLNSSAGAGGAATPRRRHGRADRKARGGALYDDDSSDFADGADAWDRRTRSGGRGGSRHDDRSLGSPGVPWRYVKRTASEPFAPPSPLRRPLGTINIGGGRYAQVGNSPYAMTLRQRRPMANRAASVDAIVNRSLDASARQLGGSASAGRAVSASSAAASGRRHLLHTAATTLDGETSAIIDAGENALVRRLQRDPLQQQARASPPSSSARGRLREGRGGKRLTSALGTRNVSERGGEEDAIAAALRSPHRAADDSVVSGDSHPYCVDCPPALPVRSASTPIGGGGGGTSARAAVSLTHPSQKSSRHPTPPLVPGDNGRAADALGAVGSSAVSGDELSAAEGGTVEDDGADRKSRSASASRSKRESASANGPRQRQQLPITGAAGDTLTENEALRQLLRQRKRGGAGPSFFDRLYRQQEESALRSTERGESLSPPRPLPHHDVTSSTLLLDALRGGGGGGASFGHAEGSSSARQGLYTDGDDGFIHSLRAASPPLGRSSSKRLGRLLMSPSRSAAAADGGGDRLRRVLDLREPPPYAPTSRLPNGLTPTAAAVGDPLRKAPNYATSPLLLRPSSVSSSSKPSRLRRRQQSASDTREGQNASEKAEDGEGHGRPGGRAPPLVPGAATVSSVEDGNKARQGVRGHSANAPKTLPSSSYVQRAAQQMTKPGTAAIDSFLHKPSAPPPRFRSAVATRPASATAAPRPPNRASSAPRKQTSPSSARLTSGTIQRLAQARPQGLSPMPRARSLSHSPRRGKSGGATTTTASNFKANGSVLNDQTSSSCAKWLDEVLSTVALTPQAMAGASTPAAAAKGQDTSMASATMAAGGNSSARIPIPLVDMRTEFKPVTTQNASPRVLAQLAKQPVGAVRDDGFSGGKALPHIPTISFKKMTGVREAVSPGAAASSARSRDAASGGGSAAGGGGRANAPGVVEVPNVPDGLPFESFSTFRVKDPMRQSAWALAPRRDELGVLPGKPAARRTLSASANGGGGGSSDHANSEREGEEDEDHEAAAGGSGKGGGGGKKLIEEVHLDEYQRPYVVLREIPRGEAAKTQREVMARLARPRRTYLRAPEK